jgi:hypothetical protein
MVSGAQLVPIVERQVRNNFVEAQPTKFPVSMGWVRLPQYVSTRTGKSEATLLDPIQQ